MPEKFDLLEGVVWECRQTAPGEAVSPKEAEALGPSGWWRARVPGTAASALADRGGDPGSVDFDGSDWWYRCSFEAPVERSPRVLEMGGMATIADIWLNGRHILHTDNMFRTYAVEPELEETNELWIRFGSVGTALSERRKRPRWKTYLIAHQNLRFVRTSLLGRLPGWAVTPPPVGPWRPVRLPPADEPRLTRRRVVAKCVGPDAGSVEVDLEVAGLRAGSEAVLVVGAARAAMHVEGRTGALRLRGTQSLSSVERWWPHTHGPQALYEVGVEVDGHRVGLGKVGFRTVQVDRSDDGFTLVVNDEPIFCRGAVWMPVDPVGLAPARAAVWRTLELARDANLNLIRVPGTGVYQDDSFWDACDELGLLVWQEAMLAFYDPPEDPEFEAELEAELEEQFGSISGRPSVAVVCGSQETEEQAAMHSLPRSKWEYPVLEETIPGVAARLLPGVPYVTSNPTGGMAPYEMDAGVSHYFGIGGYLRPVSDARRARVRFATECLAFACPPERRTVDDECGGAVKAGHDPGWKLAVHHDAGRSWDLEDMQAHYMHQLFRVDPFEIRYRDPERALDLARGTVVSLFESVLSEWRRNGSVCQGAVVLALRDLRAGPGWGVIDSLGKPKAPWFVLKRLMAPVALLVTDEGLNGLHVHLVNDGSRVVEGTVTVELFVRGELMVESANARVSVPARAGLTLGVMGMFDGFRDLTGAYAFGPPAYDVVSIRLEDDEGVRLAEGLHLPDGCRRTLESDVGLQASASGSDGEWVVDVTAGRFAQWVVVDVPGYLPEDSWFHLTPGDHKRVALRPDPDPVPGIAKDAPVKKPVVGEVRAFNSVKSARFSISSGSPVRSDPGVV